MKTKIKTKNPNCDHIRCKKPDGEVRFLPYGRVGGIILCEDCFKVEIKARKAFNKETGERLWDIPKWQDLEVYNLS